MLQMHAWLTLVVALGCVMVIALAGAWAFERRRFKLSESARAILEHDLHAARRSSDASAHLVGRQCEPVHPVCASMVGELSSALTHELNQPLTAIRSNAQAAQRMLQANEMNLRELYELLSDIVAADKRVGLVIERLRGLFTRSAKQACAVDVAELIREVLALSHSRFVASNITVTSYLSASVPPVLADRLQIQQVLLNLLLNATDAMLAHDTFERRHLSVATTLANDGSVLVTISDTGPTILAAANEALLDARSASTVSGLDLSVSKSIIAAHGGRIWAINNPGSGATFCFTLPAAPDASQPATSGTIASGLAAVCLLTLGFHHSADAQSAAWMFLKDSPVGKFSQEDVKIFEGAVQSVLASEETAARRAWVNPKSGSSGEVRLLHAFASQQGRNCKRLRIENRAGGKTARSEQTLCQDQQGHWLVDPGAHPIKRDSQRGTP